MHVNHATHVRNACSVCIARANTPQHVLRRMHAIYIYIYIYTYIYICVCVTGALYLACVRMHATSHVICVMRVVHLQ